MFQAWQGGSAKAYVYVDNLGTLTRSFEEAHKTVQEWVEGFDGKELILHGAEVQCENAEALGGRLDGVRMRSCLKTSRA